MLSPTGIMEYFSGIYMPRFDAEGRSDGIIGYFVNVTEKRAADAALAISQLQYRTLVEGSGMVTWSCSPSGRHVTPQPDWTAFTGQSAEELSVMGWTKAVHPDDLTRAEACWEKAVATGQPFSTEHRIRRHDGQWRWMNVHAVPIRNADGAIAEWFGINMDVTERKRAEQSLSASEALLRTITENSPDGIFFLDRRLNIEYLNPAALEVVRRLLRQPNASLEDLIGRPLWALLGENSMTHAFRQLDEQVMTSGEISCVEDVIDIGGSTRTLLTIRAPIRDSRGEVVGLVGIARDITARKHEELQRLASLEQQRDTLVREVHHRIKNHLHGVLGLLRMEANVHPDLAPHLSEVSNQIKAIASVYGLQCANAAAGADLDRVVRLIVASATGSVAYHGRAGEPLVLGDRDAVPVALVVSELITNALKHRTVADPARPVRVTLERVGEDTLLNVCAGPARLPAGFDYAARQGLGIGLELITTLLPSQGVNLAFFQDGDEVRAELRLATPLFISK
ncbi:MAG: PAS domain S-box protein [Methylococcus sp.]